MKHYVSPQLEAYGSVEEITRFSFDNNRTDSAFNTGPNSDITIPGLGSRDSCEANNPVPGSTCTTPPPVNP